MLISCSCASNDAIIDPSTFDYDTFVGLSCAVAPLNSVLPIPEVPWSEVVNSPQKVLVDVRPFEQYNILRFTENERIAHVPLSLLQLKDKGRIVSEILRQVPHVTADTPLFTFCRSGVTSKTAVTILREMGLDAINIAGGMLAYKTYTGKDFNPLT